MSLLPVNAPPQRSLVLFERPAEMKLLKHKAWYTQWVCTIQAFPLRKKKKSSKCQAGFSWKPLRAPSNRFPLMKHIEFLQLYREDAAVAAARGAAADSGVTAQSSGLFKPGGGWGGGPLWFQSTDFHCYDELPMKTQKTVLVLQNRCL